MCFISSAQQTIDALKSQWGFSMLICLEGLVVFLPSDIFFCSSVTLSQAIKEKKNQSGEDRACQSSWFIIISRRFLDRKNTLQQILPQCSSQHLFHIRLESKWDSNFKNQHSFSLSQHSLLWGSIPPQIQAVPVQTVVLRAVDSSPETIASLCIFFLCVSPQPKGFRRYYSSPLLIQEQYGCIKEVMPIGNCNRFSSARFAPRTLRICSLSAVICVSALLRSLR